VLAVLGMLTAQSSPSEAADKIKYGLLAGPQTIYIGIEKGFFKKYDIDVEPFVFRSGAEIVPALSTGQIDIAATAAGAALYNALARGVNAKIVGDYIVFEKLPSLSGAVVRKDLYDSGKIRTPKDLKGAKIAVTARGQAMHLLAGKVLESAGLTEKDVKLILMSQPDMLVALRSGAIDAMFNSDPFITIAEAEKIGVELVNMYTVVPDFTLGVVMYGKRVLDDRGLAVRFMKGFTEANRFLRANERMPGRKEVMEIYQKRYPVKDPALYEYARLGIGRDTMVSNLRGKNGLLEQLDWYAAQGLVPIRPKLEEAVDSSFAREAAQALGR
jgi:NitT/TauT family transport system substrate-binding protein